MRTTAVLYEVENAQIHYKYVRNMHSKGQFLFILDMNAVEKINQQSTSSRISKDFPSPTCFVGCAYRRIVRPYSFCCISSNFYYV